MPADLPPVDGLALCAAHEGRSRLLARWIDPAVVDENDPLASDPALDLYGETAQPPYSDEFLRRFRAAQAARLARIEAWVDQRLTLLQAAYGAGSPAADQVFTVHRTHADPRCLDLRLDANDRAVGSVWGDPKTVNASAYAMGRVSSLTGFLSQWSSRSQADGPANLARCSAPGAAAELHRRPEHLPEHARRLAGRGARAHHARSTSAAATTTWPGSRRWWNRWPTTSRNSQKASSTMSGDTPLERIGPYVYRHYAPAPLPPQQHARVAIVGGGPVGLATALGLARQGVASVSSRPTTRCAWAAAPPASRAAAWRSAAGWARCPR